MWNPRVGGEKISFFFTGCSPKGYTPARAGKRLESVLEGSAE